MDIDNDNLVSSIKYFKPIDMVNSSYSIILGSRRSGKSYLTEDLIKKLHKKNKLDCAILFSATNAGFECICPECRFNDIEKLHEIIDNYKVLNEYNKIVNPENKFRLKTMIILDDLVLQLKGKDFKIIEELAVLGRHHSYAPLSLHIVILAQNLTSIPRIVRNNSDYIFFNNISSERERQIVFDENLYNIDGSITGKRNARDLYNTLVKSKDYLFVVIENHRQNIKEYADYLKIYVAD